MVGVGLLTPRRRPDRNGRSDPPWPQPGADHRQADHSGRRGLVPPEAGLLVGDEDRAQEADRPPALAGLPGGQREVGGAGDVPGGVGLGHELGHAPYRRPTRAAANQGNL